MRRMGLLLLVGCGRLSFEPRMDSHEVVPTDTFPTGTFGSALAHPELDSMFEDDVALSSDLLEIYFARAASATAPGDLWHATRTSTAVAFDPPSPVVEINTPSHEGGFFVSADGRELWFSTDRTVAAGDYEIWTATRTAPDAAWQVVAPVPELNSPRADNHPRLDATGTQLVMTRLSTSLGFATADAFRASRPTRQDDWSTPIDLAELNTSSGEVGSGLYDTATLLLMCSDRPGSANVDLYIATRPSVDQPFGTPVRIDELSTSGREEDPWMSPDGKTIFFARDGDIYEASR
jgi:hypothetical protein